VVDKCVVLENQYREDWCSRWRLTEKGQQLLCAAGGAMAKVLFIWSARHFTYLPRWLAKYLDNLAKQRERAREKSRESREMLRTY